MGLVSDEAPANGDVLLKFEVKDTGLGIRRRNRKPSSRLSHKPMAPSRGASVGRLGSDYLRPTGFFDGGRIRVESTPGIGSRFYFTTRFRVADGPVGSPSAIMPAQPGLAERTHGPCEFCCLRMIP